MSGHIGTNRLVITLGCSYLDSMFTWIERKSVMLLL